MPGNRLHAKHAAVAERHLRGTVVLSRHLGFPPGNAESLANQAVAFAPFAADPVPLPSAVAESAVSSLLAVPWLGAQGVPPAGLNRGGSGVVAVGRAFAVRLRRLVLPSFWLLTPAS
jgi:hypothetical protein